MSNLIYMKGHLKHSDQVRCPRMYETCNTGKLVLANELLIYVI